MPKDRTTKISARFSLAGLALLLCLAIPGCQRTASIEPVAFTPPPVKLQMTSDSGTPLSQPPRNESSLQLTDTQSLIPLELAVLVVEDDLAGAGEPLSSKARLITAAGGSSAVLSSAHLTRSLRILAGQVGEDRWRQSHAGKLALMERLVLSPQTAVRIELTPTDETSTLRMLTLALAPITGEAGALPGNNGTPPAAGQGDVRLAVTTTGQVEVRRRRSRSTSNGNAAATPEQSDAVKANGESSQNGSPTNPTYETRAETVVVDLPGLLETAQPVILCWPMPDSPNGARQWAMVRLSSAAAKATQADLSRLNASLQASHDLLLSRPAGFPGEFLSKRADIAATLELLPMKKQRRSALVALSRTAGASLTGDLSLVADDVLLELLASRIAERAVKEPADELATLGWLMDRTSFEVVTQQTSSRVMDSLAGVLLSHLGEPARRPALMRELLESMRTRLEFETRLQAENLIALEDDSPSSRVRAHQWLVARQLAPAGYDPLASAQARQEALDKAAASPQAGATP